MSRHYAWLGFTFAPLVVAPLWCVTVAPYLPGVVGQIAGALLVQTLLVCTITDLAARKIYNWATYPAFFWALVIGLAVDLQAVGYLDVSSVIAPALLGDRGVLSMLGGAGVCFFVMMVIHAVARGGAGDVKLATVLGALLGVRTGLMAVACTFIIAAALMLSWNVLQRPNSTVRGFLRLIGSKVVPLWVRPPSMQQRRVLQQRMPLAPFFAAGTVVALLLETYR
jgi:prepilin signal peptidase PulO-like enzyme (type II secretory pathway)